MEAMALIEIDGLPFLKWWIFLWLDQFIKFMTQSTSWSPNLPGSHAWWLKNCRFIVNFHELSHIYLVGADWNHGFL